MRTLFLMSFVLASVGQAPAAAAQAVAVPQLTVDIDSFSIAPKTIHLVAGQTVNMIFVNHSGSGHDFTAKEFFARAAIRSGNIRRGTIDLPAHSTRAVTLAPAAGTYRAHCGHFLHSSFGMTAGILVD